MNDESMSDPTTGAEFDNDEVGSLQSAVGNEDEASGEDSTPTGSSLTDSPVWESDSRGDENPESDNEPDEALPELVADVAELIESGDTERALQRLGDYGRGLEKLQGQVSQANQNVEDVRTLLGAASSGNADAVRTFDDLLASYGTSIEALFAAKTATNPGTQDSDPRIAWLANRVQAMEAERSTQVWAESHGTTLSEYLEKSTGLKISPVVLAKARPYLPTKATAEDIEDAVMRVDPRAYRAALRAANGSPIAPNSAMLSRGGKGSAKIDPNALLSDARKFEAYING